MYFNVTWEDIYVLVDKPLVPGDYSGSRADWTYYDSHGDPYHPDMVFVLPGFPTAVLLWGTDPGDSPYTRVTYDGWPNTTIRSTTGEPLWCDCSNFAQFPG